LSLNIEPFSEIDNGRLKPAVFISRFRLPGRENKNVAKNNLYYILPLSAYIAGVRIRLTEYLTAPYVEDVDFLDDSRALWIEMKRFPGIQTMADTVICRNK
jgi:hypothetical protein